MFGPFHIAKTSCTGNNQRPCLRGLRLGDISGREAERKETIETMGRCSSTAVPILDLYQLYPQGLKNLMGR